jgi:hypothetical protein
MFVVFVFVVCSAFACVVQRVSRSMYCVGCVIDGVPSGWWRHLDVQWCEFCGWWYVDHSSLAAHSLSAELAGHCQHQHADVRAVERHRQLQPDRRYLDRHQRWYYLCDRHYRSIRCVLFVALCIVYVLICSYNIVVLWCYLLVY